mmetsp:Transcript_16574/g.31506  ORF Transcript_16574/g.31506 Transcript_16574/m.31506 type:complete len:237 (+) Transcript_16574:1091-1801(+)
MQLSLSPFDCADCCVSRLGGKVPSSISRTSRPVPSFAARWRIWTHKVQSATLPPATMSQRATLCRSSAWRGNLLSATCRGVWSLASRAWRACARVPRWACTASNSWTARYRPPAAALCNAVIRSPKLVSGNIKSQSGRSSNKRIVPTAPEKEARCNGVAPLSGAFTSHPASNKKAVAWMWPFCAAIIKGVFPAESFFVLILSRLCRRKLCKSPYSAPVNEDSTSGNRLQGQVRLLS